MGATAGVLNTVDRVEYADAEAVPGSNEDIENRDVCVIAVDAVDAVDAVNATVSLLDAGTHVLQVEIAESADDGQAEIVALSRQ
jgi:hypothetical protein